MKKFVNLSRRTCLRMRALAVTKNHSVGNYPFMRELKWMIDDVCHVARRCGIFGFECDRSVIYFYEDGAYVTSFLIVPEWRLVRMFLLTMLDHQTSPMEINEGTDPAIAVSIVRPMSSTRLADAYAS